MIIYRACLQLRAILTAFRCFRERGWGSRALRRPLHGSFANYYLCFDVRPRWNQGSDLSCESCSLQSQLLGDGAVSSQALSPVPRAACVQFPPASLRGLWTAGASGAGFPFLSHQGPGV